MVDGHNATEIYIFRLMTTVKLPMSKGYDTHMSKNYATHKYDDRFAHEFQKRLSNASCKNVETD